MSRTTSIDDPVRPASERRAGRAAPIYGKTLAGKIRWLPRKEELSPDLDTGLPPGVYNHPVLILSHEPRNEGAVRVLTMTSVGGRIITEKVGYHWIHRHLYLPIAPTPPHSDSDVQLHLAGDSRSPGIFRPSYVNTLQGPYTVYLDALRSHPGTSLSAKSFITLTNTMGYTEESDEIKEKMQTERYRKKVERRAMKANERAAMDGRVIKTKGQQGGIRRCLMVILAFLVFGFMGLYFVSRFVLG